ncbi:hypothetical protein [Allonocardiopsis opalescens]|uniref:Uncharacterized protein n=1 Tax=Allonocardiopsis opalescens TaxID=1144618 RepID=A0A2T0Q2M3_9ACTN|nr:hypothetical protein [Allonocardiopsis opalescens]PRX97970.1 hypothetical protein CLV72_105323 [Allonocardiopsis opalescens]
MTERGQAEPREAPAGAEQHGRDGAEPEHPVRPRGTAAEPPDVLLDVPELKVDEITLDVENLRARVSLQAEVLDLLRLNVGADVDLGRVDLTIKGVEAQALLKVRLDNVAAIIERVLRTIDTNPQILEHVTRGLGPALRDLGAGGGQAVGAVGEGAGGAVDRLGGDAGQAVRDVGRGAGEAVGEAGSAVAGLPGGAEQAVRGTGEGVGAAARRAGPVVDRATAAAGGGVPADDGPGPAVRDSGWAGAGHSGPGDDGAGPHGPGRADGPPAEGARRVIRKVRAGARQLGREAGGAVSRAARAAREAD